MKILLSAVCLILLAVACSNSQRNDDPGPDADNTKFTPPVIVPGTSNDLAGFTLTPSELLDDSVFSDGSIPTSWQNAGITDVDGLKIFLKQLQQMVILNDREGLVAAVQYPLNDIASKEALLTRYNDVFTKEVRLSFATLNFSQLFRNQNGVMTKGGKVWIRQIDEGFKIVAIN